MSEKRYCFNCGNDKAHCHCARPYLPLEAEVARLRVHYPEQYQALEQAFPQVRRLT